MEHRPWLFRSQSPWGAPILLLRSKWAPEEHRPWLLRGQNRKREIFHFKLSTLRAHCGCRITNNLDKSCFFGLLQALLMSTSFILKNTTSAPWEQFCFRKEAALRNQNKKTYSHFLITYVYFFIQGAHCACKIANKDVLLLALKVELEISSKFLLSEPVRLFESLILRRTTIVPQEQFCSRGARAVSFRELNQT